MLPDCEESISMPLMPPDTNCGALVADDVLVDPGSLTWTAATDAAVEPGAMEARGGGTALVPACGLPLHDARKTLAAKAPKARLVVIDFLAGCRR